MAMTPVKAPDYGALLNEAYRVQHELMMGAGVSVFVDQNGERIEYRQTNAGSLATYIRMLEAKCGIAGAGSGPMKVWM